MDSINTKNVSCNWNMIVGIIYVFHLIPIFTILQMLSFLQVGDVEECALGPWLVSAAGEEAALFASSSTVQAVPHHGDHSTPACEPSACRSSVCL